MREPGPHRRASPGGGPGSGQDGALAPVSHTAHTRRARMSTPSSLLGAVRLKHSSRHNSGGHNRREHLTEGPGSRRGDTQTTLVPQNGRSAETPPPRPPERGRRRERLGCLTPPRGALPAAHCSHHSHRAHCSHHSRRACAGLHRGAPVPGWRHAGPGPTQGSEVASQASALSAHPTCTDPNLPRPRLLPFGTQRPGPHDPPRMLHKHATSPRGRALQA